jgi:hypothetical protein
MTPSELDKRYPYDPAAVSENLRGLEKLRAVADRGLALDLWRLHEANLKRWAVEEGRTRYGAPRGEPDGKMRQAGEL